MSYTEEVKSGDFSVLSLRWTLLFVAADDGTCRYRPTPTNARLMRVQYFVPSWKQNVTIIKLA